LILATKPIPHASCSKDGSYNPLLPAMRYHIKLKNSAKKLCSKQSV
jgi:hypothetical protein